MSGAGKPRSVELSYWQIHGRDEGGRIVAIKDADALSEKMLGLLRSMISKFDDAATPYAPLPWPEYGPYFNDYEHLERVREWSTGSRGDA